MTRPDSYPIRVDSTALSTALPPHSSPETPSGRGDSNPGPPPPKGAEVVTESDGACRSESQGGGPSGEIGLPSPADQSATDRQAARHFGRQVRAMERLLVNIRERALRAEAEVRALREAQAELLNALDDGDTTCRCGERYRGWEEGYR